MMKSFRSAAPIAVVAGMTMFALVAGCTLAPSPAEQRARQNVAQLGDVLQPAQPSSARPKLTPESPVGDFVLFALLNHPQVVAAYHDWRAAVAAIAPTRALPDPQFTLQADIAGTLMSFMPGLMFDYMAAGKRTVMSREMIAASNVSYRTYVATVLRTAAAVRKAWIELAFVDESIRLRESSLAPLEQSLELANIDYSTGRGMGGLSNQVRVANEMAKVRTELATLSDRRRLACSRFKFALGLTATDPDPAWPQAALAVTPLPDEDELWRRVSAANPGLAQMRAMVDMALASVDVARSARTGDLALGGMLDLVPTPVMFRPAATLKLPVWQEKIAANVAAAEARREASRARVNAELINLAAELAQMIYMVREADRMIAYVEQTALPSVDRAIATSAAGYQSGMATAAMIPEAGLMALAMRTERAAALRERENAVTDLLLLTADVAPAGSPLLAAEVSQP